MDEKMVRTQVYLPRDIYDLLKRHANEEGLTMAHQIREALAQYVVDKNEADETKYVIADDDPIWELIGIVQEGGAVDGSVNHDRHIYTRDWDSEGAGG